MEINDATLALLTCSLCYASSNVFAKLLVRPRDPVTTMVFTMNGYIVLFAIIPAALDWRMLSWEMTPWLVLLAVAGFSAQSCMTRAMIAGEASVVMPFDYLRLPIAALAGFLLYREVPNLPTVLGAAVIVASVVYISLAEARLKNKPVGAA